VKVFGVTGWKNSGKTGLVTRLVTHFTQGGLKVSTVKHAHHSFDVDSPGRDSYRHREAGASQVYIASKERLALMRELRRAATGPLLAANDPSIACVASDHAIAGLAVPLFDLDDTGAIADFIVRRCGLT
jgi:tetraacyldisaccharide-1-P 4'-kinase